jgi:cobyrinic acid a,c-diamide synthase
LTQGGSVQGGSVQGGSVQGGSVQGGSVHGGSSQRGLAREGLSRRVSPRLVIAAPSSGSGKTTVATGLMAALVARGRRVAPFKIGPDYIDPGYHALATGRPGRNLDPVLVGESRVGPLFAHGAAGADIAVIEGVMGLFDGRITPVGPGAGGGAAASGGLGGPGGFGGAGFGSTAHVARLLDAPVVLVVDGRGQGRSLAALLHGFRGYDPSVRLAAVVLNQVGSTRHEEVLREACAEIGLPVLGAVPRGTEVTLPSRHLGLIPATEYGGPARQAVTAMAELITRSVDLEATCRLAESAGPAPWTAWDPATEVAKVTDPAAFGPATTGPGQESSADSGAGRPAAGSGSGKVRRADSGPDRGEPAGPVPGEVESVGSGSGRVESIGSGSGRVELAGSGSGVFGGASMGKGGRGPRPVVAVAGGAAFTFGYVEHSELLRAAGAEVVVVDPLRDVALPDGTAALVLPGGFPEEHTACLSANPKLRHLVAVFARSGGILQAECGGLLYLLERLGGEPMCGVLPGAAEMGGSLTLGYRDAVAATDSVTHLTGERVTGHEFHRTHVITTGAHTPAWFWRGHDGGPVREGFVHQRVHASYLHTHPAGHPEAVVRLVAAARGVGS